MAAELCAEGFAPEDLLFVTPFRRQREALRAALDAAGFARAEVSTVHRAQGREAPALVFDPVDEASDFLAGEAGRSLVNVALSRAQAKLVLLVAPAKLGEAHLFRRLVDLCEGRGSDEGGAAPFRLPDLAPLVAAGADLRGARLALGAGRWCDVATWDPSARRGEAIDSGGRAVTIAAPGAPPPAAPGGGWLDRFVARAFAPGFDTPGAPAAERVARIGAAAGASRLGGLWGLRGELALALALEARGRAVLDVCVRARRADGGGVDVDVVTAAGGAVAFVVSASPAGRADVAAWAGAARAIARGELAHGRRRLGAAYCYCAAGFDEGAAALLRANGVGRAGGADPLDVIR